MTTNQHPNARTRLEPLGEIGSPLNSPCSRHRLFAALIVFTVVASQAQAQSGYFHPGEPLAAESVRVSFLGTGAPFPRRGQANASVLVETPAGKLLLDVGPGSPANMTSLELPLAELDTVILSHLHVDHVGGLDQLWIGGWVYGRAHPLMVWGPPGTSEFCNHFVQAYEWDTRSRIAAGLPPEGAELKCMEYEVGQALRVKGVLVTPFVVEHIEQGRAFGLRVEHNGRTIVYSGDTSYSENLVENAQKVDLLIHEAFPPADIYARKTNRSLEVTRHIAEVLHTSPRQVGRVFAETRPRLGVIYHLYNNEDIVQAALDDIRETYDGPLRIAHDLMVIDVSEKEIRVRRAVVGDKPWPVGLERERY